MLRFGGFAAFKGAEGLGLFDGFSGFSGVGRVPQKIPAVPIRLQCQDITALYSCFWDLNAGIGIISNIPLYFF